MHIRIPRDETEDKPVKQLGQIQSAPRGIPLDDLRTALVGAAVLVLREPQVELAEILHREHFHGVFPEYAVYPAGDVREVFAAPYQRVRNGAYPRRVRHGHDEMFRLRERPEILHLRLEDKSRRVIHQREPRLSALGHEVQRELFLHAGDSQPLACGFNREVLQRAVVYFQFGNHARAEKALYTALVPARGFVGFKRFSAAKAVHDFSPLILTLPMASRQEISSSPKRSFWSIFQLRVITPSSQPSGISPSKNENSVFEEYVSSDSGRVSDTALAPPERR